MAGANDTVGKASNGERTIVFTAKVPRMLFIADYVEIQIEEKSNDRTTKKPSNGSYCNKSMRKESLCHISQDKKTICSLPRGKTFVYKLKPQYFGGTIFDRLFIASITANGH